jgi:hypothetical protein
MIKWLKLHWQEIMAFCLLVTIIVTLAVLDECGGL